MLKVDQKIKKFLEYIKNNGDIEKLGTNSDNKTEAIHRWFSFLPGFSHVFVKTTIEYFKPDKIDEHYNVFDPFIGSATTAVVGGQLKVNVIGNESNPFLYKIGMAKIHRIKNPESLEEIKKYVMHKVRSKWKKQDISEEDHLLSKCYTKNNLKKLVAFRNIYFSNSIVDKFKPYIFVAISSLLSKSSNVGISIPYVSWNHTHIPEEPLQLFQKFFDNIKEDLKLVKKSKDKSKIKIYLHDTRIKNDKLKNNSIDLVFTSPPYLNNFDYGEALKVYTYFWSIAKDWHEITEKIRKKSLTSATTHYKEKDYIFKTPPQMLGNEINSSVPKVASEIAEKVALIQKAKSKKNREKSFDILTALYFKDMFKALKEIYRVLKKNSLCFMVIGDSAPYGIYVPTDELLGKMGLEMGFSKYLLQTLRPRGYKWLNLTYRHKVQLRESLLILKK